MTQTEMPASPRLPALWAIAFLFFLLTNTAHASVAMLMEESYGTFGTFAPTGHAAVYLNHVCAASQTSLRPCQPGEFGVVISRYHRIHGYDWVAIPLIPYLYAVDDADEVPSLIDQPQVDKLRDTYRRANLEALAPDSPTGETPDGDWTQLIGSSYDRAIHGFQAQTTPEQDEHFIATFNDRRNVSHFNILFRNCADFSRGVLNIYFPHAIHRSIVADLGMTTPKQVAKSFVSYGRKHPELEMSAFVISQVPGDVPRSRPAKGVTESLIKSKKYLLPLAVLNPPLTGGVVVAYLVKGRMDLPKDATVVNVDDVAAVLQQSPTEPPPVAEPSTPPTAAPSTPVAAGAASIAAKTAPLIQ